MPVQTMQFGRRLAALALVVSAAGNTAESAGLSLLSVDSGRQEIDQVTDALKS